MRKLTFGSALALAAVAGTVVGLGISSRLDLVPPSFSNDPKVALSGRAGQMPDFVSLCRAVTPAVVSITTSKVVRPNMPQSPFDGGFGREFFHFPAPRAQRSTSLGSGVIVSADGIAVTNNHVVEESDQIEVVLQDRRRFRATIVGTDPKTDMAVIRLQGAKNLPTVAWGDSKNVQVGEWVLAIGNPMGLSSTVTAGIISAEGRADVGVAEFEDFLQTDAAINPGNSGGALVTLKGELVGINTAIASRGGSGGSIGIGFAIPSRMARPVMEMLVAKGKVTRGYIGVSLEPMTAELAKHFNWNDPTKGILIAEVQPRTPAVKAGLQDGDIIVGLNGESVTEVNRFRNTIALTAPGSSVTLAIVRKGKPLTVTVTLAELPGARSAPAQPEALPPAAEMGFDVDDLTPDLHQRLQLPPDAHGALVTGVAPDSAAAEAGLDTGDLIVAVNRRPVASADDFSRAVGRLQPGSSLLLRVQRGEAGRYIAFRIE
jgi:serine protease Do